MMSDTATLIFRMAGLGSNEFDLKNKQEMASCLAQAYLPENKVDGR